MSMDAKSSKPMALCVGGGGGGVCLGVGVGGLLQRGIKMG